MRHRTVSGAAVATPSTSVGIPLDDKGPLEWILGIQVKRDRTARTLTMSQELYIQDIVAKHAAHLEGISRHFDSPMAEDSQLYGDDSPE